MVFALAAIAAVALANVAVAQARGLRPGVASAAPTSRALSAALKQSTGLAPSQVTIKDICPAARPGYARCAGQALVLRSNHARVRPHVPRRATFGRVAPSLFVPGFVQPATASAAAPPTPNTPAYLQQAYDLSYLSQTRGVGDTIAIVDPFDDPSAEADLAVYRAQYGLPACTSTNGCFTKLNQSGNASPLPAPSSTWEQEMSLDLDAVSALCPNCHIMLVEASSASSTDLSAAMATAAAKGANQISASWTIAVNGILSGAFVFPNVSTVAATGDTGYLGTSLDNYPAAFSSVTAAGGTTLAPTGGARGFSEGAWSLSGGQGGGSGCDLHVRKPTWQTDGGCSQQSSGKTFGRAYADISADADPATGLSVYDSNNGGWGVIGGTSLATPLIAAYYAITGVNGTTPQWAYTSSALLNDPTTGSSGTTCAAAIRYICNAGPGYDGPTGVGSISGAVTSGAPGIGGAPISSGNLTTYTQSTRSRGATIKGGIYPNGSDTTWWIEYGTTTSYGSQTLPTDIGSGTPPVSVTGYLSGLSPATTYHYRLVARNGLGTTSGYDYTFTTPQSSPNDPTAAFSAPSATAPSSATAFDATNSVDAGDAITDYMWDFGDGHTVDAGPSATASHAYAALGTYNVTLIVTSSDGHSDSVSQQITVDNPTASFTAPQVVAPGDQASFDASASTDSLGTITDYSWDFGDGHTLDGGTNPVTTHPFARGTYTVRLTITNSLAQQVTTAHNLTVDVAPTASFTAPTGIQATHTPLVFDGTASTPQGSIVDYSWRFNDGTGPVDTGTSSVANHQYVSPGVYTVRLTVTDDLGLTGSTTQIVTVDQPTAAFAVPATPAPGTPASFDASGSSDLEGSITDYSWDFGDQSPPSPVDAGTNPITPHTFTTRGTYHVTLTVTNDSQQTDQITQDVTVDNPPNAAISPSATLATPGSTLSFDGTASTPGAGGTIKDYKWNFGDLTPTDDTGTTASDSHTFNLPGAHTVSLTVTDDLGITSTATQVVMIDQPSAAFTAPQTIIAPNSPASFDATGSGDPGGTIADYSWDFGDGHTVDAGTSATTTHSYAARGVHHVTLTVTNNSGQTNQIEHDVKVDSAPTAAFSTPAGAQTPGTSLGFDASASAAAPPDGSIATYSWTFGDGATAMGVSTNHSYNAPGQYTVSLTVTDELGLSNTTTHQVTVDAAPVAAFSAAPSPATAGPSVAFDGSGSSDTLGSITSYSWEFGDGAAGSGPTASHPYAAPGRYTVKLRVTNDAGQTATVSHSVMIDAPPKALFSVSPTAVITGAAVAFNASSSSDDVGTISDYAWSFGDGTRASGPTASHSYASPGTYTVGLTVTNDAGQSTSTSQTVSVYSAPLASFSINPGFAQPGAAVVVNAGSSSDPGGAITAYSWSFGDGGTASGPTPTHAYANPGTYTVTLTVTGSLGLVTSTSHAVTINPRPLSVQFSSSKQSLKAVLKHGLKVTLSTSAPAKASFVVTMPTPPAKQQRKHGKRVARARTSTILRTRALSYEPGTHSASLNLSAATVAKLRTAGKPVTLTVHMILTDVYGRTIGRSVKLTVTR